jgi:exodeoxyribonuclease VII large subunit
MSMVQQKILGPSNKPFSIVELTFFLKNLIENNENLQGITVQGEISNITKHSSGNWYFTLKDEHSQISAVMFMRNNRKIDFDPKHGDLVIVKGNIRIYEARGQYQIIVDSMKKGGKGDLHQKFLALKEKLLKEGLFERKRKIVTIPKTVGIVTSSTGAAIRDIIDTIKRRFPAVKIILAPAIVQGDKGSSSIINALMQLERCHQKETLDTIIIARGGGSLEDLWNFNEENVARAVFNSSIPIIAGIGHETDFTIVDFVADLRAPTPSIAAELAVPSSEKYLEQIKLIQDRMSRALQNKLDIKKQKRDEFQYRLNSLIKILIEKYKKELFVLSAKLSSLNPNEVLKRGYSITTKNGQVIRDRDLVSDKDSIVTIVANGSFVSKVEKK